MSATSTGPGAIADVHAYAAEVRRHLVGLTPEQVDDLTDGLEADLGDALADSPGTEDLVARFGEPRVYAAELRAAAGLPSVASAAGPRRLRTLLAAPFRGAFEACVEGIGVLRAQSWWPPVGELLTVLVPVGWVLRGWMAYQFGNVVLSKIGTGRVGHAPWVPYDNGFLLLAMLATMLVSVQWGRGLWLPRGRLHSIPRFVTVVTVVVALPVVVWLGEQNSRIEYRSDTVTEYVSAPQPDGVVVGGMGVSNLFVYDAEGNPLDDVQIYDDRGRPVETTSDDGFGVWELYGVDQPWRFTSVDDEDGRVRWNVYPLRGAPLDDYDSTGTYDRPTLLPGASVRTPPRPFAKAPAIDVASPDGETVDGEADPGVVPDPAGGSSTVAPDGASASATVTPTGVPTP